MPKYPREPYKGLLNAYTPTTYIMNNEKIIAHGRACFRQYGKLTAKVWSEYVDNWNNSHGYRDRLTKLWYGIPKSTKYRFGGFRNLKYFCGLDDKKVKINPVGDDRYKRQVASEQEWIKQFDLKKK
ncbi:MAG: hypothetical protein ACXACU_07860 [Candidatus Hodarchaeales archaeon]